MLLFFDIDGTLIDDKFRLVPSVKPAMQAAHRNGHRLIINTGRTLCNLDDRLNELPLDGWILGCGTRILYHGETLQCMEHSPEDTLRLRNLFLELKLPVVYECDTAIYFDPLSPDYPVISGFRGYAKQHGIAREVSETDPDFKAVKMFCFTDDRNLIHELERRTTEIGMAYIAIDRGNGGWETVPAAYSKATGIDTLCRKLSIGLDECFVFGDSKNDMAMLQHVKHSVAMGNAPDDVKSACSYVTARPEDDGIELALKHFGLT